MPQILIFGNFYAPEHTGIAPYTTEIAEHLAAIGWRVRVVSGMPHYPQWRVQDPYRGRLRLREERGGVDVRRVWQYVPAQQSALGRSLYEVTFFTHALTHAFSGPVDCVVGVVPGIGGGAAAALAARRQKSPFGLIIQDLVGQAAAQSGIPGGGLAARPAAAVEGWMLRRADKVGVITDSFRPYLDRSGVAADRITLLPNWAHVEPPIKGATDLRRTFGWDENRTVVLHAGNIGFKQDLGTVVDAARLAAEQDLPIHFAFMGDGNERRRLEEAASGLKNVQFIDPQPSESFMGVLASADMLLVNERPSVRDMSLPSKITSYFRAGRPVVAGVTEGGATDAELRRSGGALVVPAGDHTALLAAISSVAGDRGLADRLVERATEHADRHFDRTALLNRMTSFIAELASASGRPAS